jgi:hypothetical protein
MYRIYSIHLKNTNRRTGLYMTGNVVVYGVLGSWCLTPLSTIAIDLMLPARLSDMKVMRRRHKSNTDAHSAEMDHNIKRVKQLLQNKFWKLAII